MGEKQVTEDLQQPSFQWEAPVLHTEEWLNTLGGTGTFLPIEDVNYHT